MQTIITLKKLKAEKSAANDSTIKRHFFCHKRKKS